MNTNSSQRDGSAWRTFREAAGVLVRSPLGCVALGVSLLGVAGVLRQSSELKRAEAERVSWARNADQDLRDSLRDESAVRSVKVAPTKAARDRSRAKALRAEVGAALREALASSAPR
ncbi:hypothetical protein EPO15_13655 [bacterium]|nr:MAG: hypothetical protein EPO15_13655 [bacterium]